VILVSMKLLILTQAVDLDNPILGFFHEWIVQLALRAESIHVICLFKGRHSLPKNVTVHSLGKEGGESKVKYLFRFYNYVWKLRREYEAIFVHMNQEYCLLGGPMWRVLNKRVYLWRNYHHGTLVTDLAALFCTKVFCTSKSSYTAQYKKTTLMPVGVDTGIFAPNPAVHRVPNSVLFLSGMWPSKRPELLIEALETLAADSVEFSANIYGSPLAETSAYYESIVESVKTKGLVKHIQFYPGVTLAASPKLFQSHAVFVNCSFSGMFDKTMLEAAACGAQVVAASDDFALLAGEQSHFTSADSLALRLKEAFLRSTSGAAPVFVQEHSLISLMNRLIVSIKS
jgi:glycosyltransferase involved in cell wall biosynthesis